MSGYPSKGLECPHCGGRSRCTKAGRANDGSIMVRMRRCDECKRTEQTLEFFMPHGLTSIEKLDEEDKHRRIMRQRKLYGYLGTNRGHPKSVDKLRISVKVIPGEVIR